MDFNDITLFSTMKKKFAWLSQRQEVLAENIANADSPGYQARDLKPFDFKRILQRQKSVVNLDQTNPLHIAGRHQSDGDFQAQKERKPYETAPDGNSVILEEQMQKMNETGTTHRLMTELYKKNLNLFKIALGK
jgi:flagellar basal-body rod protein FlgB